jgi:hypothetical protein
LKTTAAIMSLFCLCGCVERRLTVRSNPPGAILYVDNYEVGPTPISVGFTYYGTREFKLVKDRFETLTVKQAIEPPWYQIFPADFVTENLVPGQVRDQRTLDFQMKPQMVVPTDQLVARAEELRRTAHGAPASPDANVWSPAAGPAPFPAADSSNQRLSTSPPAGETPSTTGSMGGQPLHPLPNGR